MGSDCVMIILILVLVLSPALQIQSLALRSESACDVLGSEPFTTVS